MCRAGEGQENNMSVAAAAILDSEGLTISEDFGIQRKHPMVQQNILTNLTKVRLLFIIIRIISSVPTFIIPWEYRS
jgi:hypothetical protein